jgi:glutamate dehydrogenase/leucine dehydrogenase
MARTYSINLDRGSLTAAVTTLLEFTAPATKSLIVTRAWIAQNLNTTSAQIAIQLVRKSAAGTAVASGVLTNAPVDAGDSAFGGTSRQMCTALGTLTTVVYPDAFNFQNGWLWLPVPEERIIVPGAGILGMHMAVAPPAYTVGISCGFEVIELG